MPVNRNKRPKRPGDLAALLANPDAPDHAWYQGVISAIDLTTGTASVELAGGIIQTNVVIVGDTAGTPADEPVMVLRLNARYFVIGPVWSGVTTQRPLQLLDVIQYTAAGTSNFVKATYPTGRRVHVRVQGGGGGGGGAPASTAGNVSLGAAASGGGYAESWLDFSALGTSETVTVGASGSITSGGAGGAGGNSSFGALVAATGGAAGAAVAAGSTVTQVLGATGSPATAGQIQSRGGGGHMGYRNATTGFAGAGGSSVFGGGGVAAANGSGGAAGIGGGGGGTINIGLQAARSGGLGGLGLVIVEVYG